MLILELEPQRDATTTAQLHSNHTDCLMAWQNGRRTLFIRC
jgi:hypothetical protein